MSKVIEFRNVTKSYDDGDNVIENLNLSVDQGALVTLLGPSGCGKTTLLKMVNKLIIPNSGSIFVDGVDINDIDAIDLRRSIGYVIQQVGLLPHLTIKANINYVLSLIKAENQIKDNRALELIELVGLDQDYLSRYPRQLSGGQKQRVGVARALAANPAIILMDEPFGAVDEIARALLQDELMKIHDKLKKTILFVTHDIEEAIKLGTKVVLLNNAKIEQMGTKEDLIFRPKTDFVKEFFGLKGFKATLDSDVMYNVYNKLLNNSESLDSLYKKLDF